MTTRPASTPRTRLTNRPLTAALVWLLAAACGGDEATAPDQGSGLTTAGSSAGAAGQPATAGRAGTAAVGTGSAGSTSTPGPVAGSSPSAAGAAATAGSAAAGGPAAAGAAATAGAPAAAGAGAPAPIAGTGGPSVPAGETVPTVYWLDITGNSVYRSTNFAPGEVLVARTGTAPDGVSVDLAGGKIYWTNMGNLLGTGGGTLQRANLDGSNVETIVMAGIATTPKQMQIDHTNQKIYWADREGATLWRAAMDGSGPEALVTEHGLREVVGVALDVPAGKVYFTDRLGRKILRTNIQLPAGETDANRSDVEELLIQTGNATPIDLDIDHDKRMIYWTDRQVGTVHRMGLDIPAGQTAAARMDVETLVDGLTEPIGMSLDIKRNKMYFTELNGGVSEAALDGSGLKRGFLSSGSSTGVAYVDLPK